MAADAGVLLWVTLAYFAVVFGVSLWGYRRATSEVEFLAAGRTIGPWVGGAVLAATQISAGTFVGTLGRHYLTGVSWTWIWFGVWAGWLTSAIFVAPKLRRFGALTVADYVGTRFASEGARTLAAALIIVTYSILLTAQFQAIGEIASAVLGLSPLLAMGGLLASTGLYTALGGVRASSYIEFIQTLIMVLALVSAVPVVLVQVGGLTALGEYVGSIEPRVTGWWFSWQELLAFGLSFGLGIAAAPYEMTRYYSMRDVATVRYAIGISILLQVIIGSSVTILGIGMRGVFPFLPSADQASSIMAYGDAANPRIALSRGDALGHHVHGQLDPPRYRRGLRARPVQAAREPVCLGTPARLGEPLVHRRARHHPVLDGDAEARRRAGDRDRAGQVHRELLLRAGGARPELAARHQGRRDLEHAGRVPGLSGLDLDVAAKLRFARHRRGGGGRGRQRDHLRAGQPCDAADPGAEPGDLL
jgi:Sodium:solute symporter family